MSKKKRNLRSSLPLNQNIRLAAGANLQTSKRVLPWKLRSVLRCRQDIRNWNIALDMYRSADYPKTWPLQLLLDEIMIDAHLTSQVENRKQQTLAAGYSLKKPDGSVDEEQTKILTDSGIFRKLTNAMLDSLLYDYSVVELSIDADKNIQVALIPRTNIIPQQGVFYPDYVEEINPVYYRQIPEFGTWILEFNPDKQGLLNKAVPHVLFKRFTQSCWTELCEIYGIPPRVLKTNTNDATMLSRAEGMMRDIGAAAWFIIDETESLEWANGIATNGDIYNNLITVCRNEISLLISGAVIGQDTVHGNKSKDESSQNVLWNLVHADKALCEEFWNKTVLPALVKIGLLTPGSVFEFDATEDIDQLFQFTAALLPFKNIDDEWIKDKFGVAVTGDRNLAGPDANQLKADNDFFV